MNPRQIIDHPRQLHFVTFSTYQRRRFLEPERARFIVMEALQECLVSRQANCHGFVVMPNHLHILLTVDAASTLGAFLKVWKRTSSYRIKRFYEQEKKTYLDQCPQDCPIWQAGYYDYNPERDEKVVEKLEYMHSNPVRAGLAAIPTDWIWSSARFYEKGEAGLVTITPPG